jgi:thiol-disulfide isomerase/thioredoxin
MGKPVRVVIWVAVLALVLVGAKLGLSSSHTSARGRPAPKLPVEQLAGPRTTLASLVAGAHGRPVVVVFWASWCGPCHQEAPALERFSQSAEGRGRLVGVDWSDSLGGARAFVRHYRWTFPVLRDGEGLVGNEYGFPGLPASFVVDGHRRIRELLPGPQSEASLRRALARVG